jgi:hypothetical protein
VFFLRVVEAFTPRELDLSGANRPNSRCSRFTGQYVWSSPAGGIPTPAVRPCLGAKAAVPLVQRQFCAILQRVQSGGETGPVTCPAFKAGDSDSVGVVGSTPTRFRQLLRRHARRLRVPGCGSFAGAKVAGRKARKFDPAREVRRRAREKLGMPPRERILADKRRKPPKHKKQFLDEQLA